MFTLYLFIYNLSNPCVPSSISFWSNLYLAPQLATYFKWSPLCGGQWRDPRKGSFSFCWPCLVVTFWAQNEVTRTPTLATSLPAVPVRSPSLLKHHGWQVDQADAAQVPALLQIKTPLINELHSWLSLKFKFIVRGNMNERNILWIGRWGRKTWRI